jgi:2'-5' RNA ligase
VSGEKPIRSFVAVEVPEASRGALDQILAGLRGTGDVRWVTRDQYHLTLKFMGNASHAQLEAVAGELATIAKIRLQFMLELSGLGGFPRLERPRVVWLGVSAGAAELVELAGAVDASCATSGFAREGRPFRPHLTLGRVRSPRDLAALAARLRSPEASGLDPFLVRELLLVESDLRPGGAVYSVRGRFPLAEQESRAPGPI